MYHSAKARPHRFGHVCKGFKKKWIDISRIVKGVKNPCVGPCQGISHTSDCYLGVMITASLLLSDHTPITGSRRRYRDHDRYRIFALCIVHLLRCRSYPLDRVEYLYNLACTIRCRAVGLFLYYGWCIFVSHGPLPHPPSGFVSIQSYC